MIKTNSYKYKATIDWVEIEVNTVNDSNFNVLRMRFDSYYVKPINPKAGGATNKFTLRIHDVTSWNQIDCLIGDANLYTSIASVTIIGIEISFDAFHIFQNEDEVINKTAQFYWFLQNPSSINVRASGSYKGSSTQLPNFISAVREIKNGKSIYIGSQSKDSISQRIYYKTTDNNKILPIDEHRARYELILLRENCPFTTLSEARNYQFQKLAKWFKFRKIKENQTALQNVLLNATKQLGSINLPRRAGGGLRVNRYGTVADMQLNRLAYDKLRELTKRLTN